MASSAASPFLHPVLMFAVQSTVSAVALDARRSPRTTWLSLATVPVQVSCVGAIIYRARDYIRPAYAAWVSSFSITTFLRCLGQCYIRKKTATGSTAEKVSAGDGEILSKTRKGRLEIADGEREHPRALLQRLWRKFVYLMDFRHLNSTDEAKNSPHFSSQDPTYIPSRGRFLGTQAVKAICSYLFIDFLTGSPLPPNATIDFAPDRMHFFTRLGSVTISETIQRYVMAVSVLAIGAAMLEVLHPLVAFIAVALGGSEPRDWRPQFGSLASAYTVRGFWGEVWHQDLRITFTTMSDWMADTVFGSSDAWGTKRVVKRYAKLVLVFGISGVLHWLDEVAAGVPGSKAKSYVFFLYQALGIMIEDAVEAVFASSEESIRQQGPGWVARIGGYVWTLSFFAWSIPWWVYPATHHAAVLGSPPQSLVPYSFLKQRWT